MNRRTVTAASHKLSEAGVARAQADLLQAEDDLHVAKLDAEQWAWRESRPSDDLWPDAEARAIETRQLECAVQERVNKLRDRLEALRYEHDRMDIAAPGAA